MARSTGFECPWVMNLIFSIVDGSVKLGIQAVNRCGKRTYRKQMQIPPLE